MLRVDQLVARKVDKLFVQGCDRGERGNGPLRKQRSDLRMVNRQTQRAGQIVLRSRIGSAGQVRRVPVLSREDEPAALPSALYRPRGLQV